MVRKKVDGDGNRRARGRSFKPRTHANACDREAPLARRKLVLSMNATPRKRSHSLATKTATNRRELTKKKEGTKVPRPSPD